MWYMNEEREMLQSMAREFAETEIKPFINEMEENSSFPHEIMRKAAECGITGLILPEDCDGMGPKWVDFGICLEEVAKESVTVANCLASQYAGTSLLTMLGRDDVVEKVLKPICHGDFIMATSQCEPAGQTRLIDHKSTFYIDPETNEVVLNASKIFTTNAGEAEYYLVCAKATDPEAVGGHFGYVLVHKDTPGCICAHVEHKIGWNGSSTGSMIYNNVRVPMDNLLLVMDIDEETTYYGGSNIAVLVALSCVGGAEGVLKKTIENARSRMHGGVSLWDSYQAMRHTIAELWMDVQIMKNAVYSILENIDRGDPDALADAWTSKVKAARMFEKVASECIVLNGGNGVIRENGIERYLRDAKVCAIGCFALPHITEMIANHIE